VTTRLAGKWGKGAPRQRSKSFDEPLKWNRKSLVCDRCGEAFAEKQNGHFTKDSKKCYELGEDVLSYHRRRVFSLSLGDWLDDEVPIEWLADMLDVIRRCPSLDFQLLTKRPELWMTRINDALVLECGRARVTSQPEQWLASWLSGKPPANIWLGVSVENRRYGGPRIDVLRATPAKVRFLSIEPLLEDLGKIDLTGIHLVIVGGESGHGARPMDPRWVRPLRDQCQKAGVAFFFKQWGEWGEGKHGMKRTDAHQFGESGPWAGDSQIVYRIGKKNAGRELDGREWNEMPPKAT